MQWFRFSLIWHYFQLVEIKWDVFRLALTFSCNVTFKSFIRFWYNDCICSSLLRTSCICVMIAFFRNDKSSVSFWISFCIFCNVLQEFMYVFVVFRFLHLLFEDPNFDIHPPSNYKILDIFPMINEGQVKNYIFF